MKNTIQVRRTVTFVLESDDTLYTEALVRSFKPEVVAAIGALIDDFTEEVSVQTAEDPDEN